MKHNLLSRYKLEKRLSKLESLVVERSVGRGGGPSKAYQIWDYLMNNGPKSVSDLKSALPKEVTNFINFYADNGLLNKNGNTISANADYKWDDVGVIPRTAQQELMNDIRNGDADDIPLVDFSEEPARSSRVQRQRAVKQSLFSRKFDEVKAAVDAGQDVNQTNDKGQTPLIFAANAKTGDYSDIITYLLQHGADLSFEFKNNNAYELAIKNANKSAMKAILANDVNGVIVSPSKIIYRKFDGRYIPQDAELIELAASKEKSEFDDYVHLFYCTAFTRGTISREKYEQLIKLIMSNSSRFIDLDDDSFSIELKNGIINTLECVIDTFSVFPSIGIYKNLLNQTMAADLLELHKKAVTDKLKIRGSISRFVEHCYTLCKIAKQSPIFLGDLLTPQLLSKLDYVELNTLFVYAIRGDNQIVLRSLASSKKKLIASYVIRSVKDYNYHNLRLITKIIDKDTLSSLDSYDIKLAILLNSEHLIQYFIDNDLADKILYVIDDMNDDNSAVKLCRKVLVENGVGDQRNHLSKDAVYNRDRRNSIINSILAHIKNDTMSTEIRRIVDSDPSILDDDKIQNALSDSANTDSATARQFKRQYDQWAATQDKPKYDL